MKNIIIIKRFKFISLLIIIFTTTASAQNDFWQLINQKTTLPNIGGIHNIWLTIFSFLLAGFLGAIVSYRRKIDSYGLAVMEAHIILAFAASLMMMIIGSEIARAFGLMGAATIVRYRYSLSNPREASSLVIALGIGMACGVGLYLLAIIATFFVRVGFNIFNIIPSFILNWIFDIKHNFILKLSVPTVASSVLMEDIDEIFSKENLSYKLISSKEKKSAPEQTLLTYELVLDDLDIKDDITQKLKELKFEVIDVMWTEKKADKVSDYFSVKSIGD
ncbi:MAG: MgtC/SapB family protein [Ignavibacteria bacterium]